VASDSLGFDNRPQALERSINGIRGIQGRGFTRTKAGRHYPPRLDTGHKLTKKRRITATGIPFYTRKAITPIKDAEDLLREELLRAPRRQSNTMIEELNLNASIRSNTYAMCVRSLHNAGTTVRWGRSTKNADKDSS